jgi:hypothetical protein
MKRRSSLLVALVLALSALGLSGPVAAQGSPADPVNGILDAMVAKQFDQLPDFVCEEYKAQVSERFDLGALLDQMPEGVDTQALVDALELSIEGRSVEIVSQEAESAVVRVAGSLVIDLDVQVAREFVRQVLEVMGQEATDEMIDMLLPELMSSLQQNNDLSDDVDVTLEDGQWLVCEALGEDGPDETEGPTETFLPMGDLCALVTIDELNSLDDTLQYANATAGLSDCTFAADLDVVEEYFTLSIRYEEGELDPLKDIFEGGQDVTIAGFPAYATETATWVDIGERLFTIQPVLLGTLAESVDPIAYAAAVGELVVPRAAAAG